MDETDEMVRRARSGDGEALGWLFDRFYRPVFGYLCARTRDPAQAEDITADVFVEVAERIRRFRGDESAFVAWVFTIARHDLIDVWRAERRHPEDPVAEVPEAAAVADVAEEVARRVDAREMFRALDRLTTDQRDVLALKYACDLSNAEAAKVLGKPVGAIKSLQHRALVKLRQLLDEEREEQPSGH